MQRKNRAYVSVHDDVTETSATTRKGAERRMQEGGARALCTHMLRRDSWCPTVYARSHVLRACTCRAVLQCHCGEKGRKRKKKEGKGRKRKKVEEKMRSSRPPGKSSFMDQQQTLICTSSCGKREKGRPRKWANLRPATVATLTRLHKVQKVPQATHMTGLCGSVLHLIITATPQERHGGILPLPLHKHYLLMF